MFASASRSAGGPVGRNGLDGGATRGLAYSARSGGLATVGRVTKPAAERGREGGGAPPTGEDSRVVDGGGALSNELAAEFNEPLGNVSYHVVVLRDLGMIELVDTAARRGAIEHY